MNAPAISGEAFAGPADEPTVFSPGPWSIDGKVGGGDEIAVMEPNGSVICGVWQLGSDFDNEEGRSPNAEANARLIAAAPEMAELLRSIGVLVSAPVNRFGKPEFYSSEEMAAREHIRSLAVQFKVAVADTVLHQAGAVIRAALAKAAL